MCNYNLISNNIFIELDQDYISKSEDNIQIFGNNMYKHALLSNNNDENHNVAKDIKSKLGNQFEFPKYFSTSSSVTEIPISSTPSNTLHFNIVKKQLGYDQILYQFLDIFQYWKSWSRIYKLMKCFICGYPSLGSELRNVLIELYTYKYHSLNEVFIDTKND